MTRRVRYCNFFFVVRYKGLCYIGYWCPGPIALALWHSEAPALAVLSALVPHTAAPAVCQQIWALELPLYMKLVPYTVNAFSLAQLHMQAGPVLKMSKLACQVDIYLVYPLCVISLLLFPVQTSSLPFPAVPILFAPFLPVLQLFQVVSQDPASYTRRLLS